MTIPSASNYPTSLDTSASLLGDPADQIVLTLATTMSTVDTAVVVSESIVSVNVPTQFVFATGEIVYVTAKNNSTKTLTVERSVSIGHTAGELLRLSVTSQYFKQIKRALIAIETELGTVPKGAYADVKAALAYAVSGVGSITTELGTSPKGTFASVVARLNDADVRIDTSVVYLKVLSETTPLTVGDGVMTWFVPPELDGATLEDCEMYVFSQSTSGKPTVQIWNGTYDVLSTKLSVDINENSSITAAVPAVINAAREVLTAGMKLRFDVDIAGTGTAGLDISLKIVA